MSAIQSFVLNFFSAQGCALELAHSATFWTLLTGLFLAALFIGWLGHHITTPIVLRLVRKTKTVLDDYFFNAPVLKAFWHVVPGLLFFAIFPSCATELTSAGSLTVVTRAAEIYITVTVIMLITAFLTNATNFALGQDNAKNHHILGIVQFLKVLTYFLGGIVIVAFFLGRNPFGLVAGLGAAATVLKLVFKDPILGLVAGIQLSANNMMKPGDWVTIEKLGIDGTVEQVSLTTVKIRNFDNTISTVPPYTLVSDAFRNWDGMVQKRARRVKRSLFIDVNSIHYASDAQLAALKAADMLAEVDAKAEAEQVVNLTLYRHYIEMYLSQQPHMLHTKDGHWLMARQLEPTPHGIPVEIWFFLSEIRFDRFEDLAALYMENIIAAAPSFGIRLFQQPAGADFQKIQ